MGKRVIRSLRCELTDDEVAEHASIAAEKQAERDDVEEKREEASKSAKNTVKQLDREMRDNLKRVRTRQIHRDVECEETAESLDMVTVRLDTGEEVFRRPLTLEERQGKLYDLGDNVHRGDESERQDEVDRAPAGA